MSKVTEKKYVLQRRNSASVQWEDAGIAYENLEWVKALLASFNECDPLWQYRIVERRVVTTETLAAL